MLTPLLFEPITIGGLNIPNRITMPPMHSNLGSVQDGITDGGIDFYHARAKGGFGLIGVGVIDAYFQSHAGSPDELFLENDRHIKRYRQLVNLLKREGSIPYAQIGVRRLFHVSRLHRLKGIDRPSLSEIPNADIEEMINAVVMTSIRAAEAGFQAIDILGVGGSGHSLFTSKIFNDRIDKWGGSPENRIRFSVETVKGIKKALGDDFPVFYRFHGSEFLPGGYTIEGAKFNAMALEEAGVSYFNITGGGHATSVPQLTPNVPRGTYAYLAREVKKVLKTAKVATSNRNNDPFEAETLLREGMADLVSLARQALADPDWPQKVKRRQFHDIRYCIACNECMDIVVIHNKPIRCLVNPRVGAASEVKPIPQATEKKEILVIGGGVTGLQFALTAARRGHKVKLLEKKTYLGGLWHQAAAPHGRTQLFTFVQWLTEQCDRANIEITLGVEATPELIKSFNVNLVVVSPSLTQAKSNLSGAGLSHVFSAVDAFDGRIEIGKNVVVIGGGGIGLEAATYLAQRANPPATAKEFIKMYSTDPDLDLDIMKTKMHKVTLISRQRRLGGTVGGSTRWVLQKEAELAGVQAIVNASAREIKTGEVVVETNSDVISIPADTVFLATGLTPNIDLFNKLKKSDLDCDIQMIGEPDEVMHAISNVAKAFRLGLLV